MVEAPNEAREPCGLKSNKLCMIASHMHDEGRKPPAIVIIIENYEEIPHQSIEEGQHLTFVLKEDDTTLSHKGQTQKIIIKKNEYEEGNHASGGEQQLLMSVTK